MTEERHVEKKFTCYEDCKARRKEKGKMTECGLVCRVKEAHEPSQCKCNWKDTKFTPPKAVATDKHPKYKKRYAAEEEKLLKEAFDKASEQERKTEKK